MLDTRPTGNWRGFRQADDDCASWDLVQSRTANAVNEITGITNTVGTPWSQPAYDPAGNMTSIPWAPPAAPTGLGWANMTVDDWANLTVDQWATLPVEPGSNPPPTGSLTATYDAWNRLVKLVNAANTDVVQENQYDARTFRIVRKDYEDGDLAETRRFFYTPSWRCVEERLSSSTGPDRQFVWGLRYIDDIVLRDRHTEANSSSSSSGTPFLNERLYALQDGNWNVVAIVEDAGSVQERYRYDSYGNISVMSAAFGVRSASDFAWETTYAGYHWDLAIAMFVIRFRILQPFFGWAQRDPVGYASGAHLSDYCSASPASHVDPLGLDGLMPFGHGGIMPSKPYYPPATTPSPPPQTPTPNLGSGIGTYHTTTHTMRFTVNNGMSCKEIERMLYGSLTQFSHFNDGANTVATVSIDGGGHYANFDAKGCMGWFSDRINADKTPVYLNTDESTNTVTATTLEGHMLEGQRKWWVRVQPNQYCGCTVWLYTTAYERKTGSNWLYIRFNHYGALWLAGTEKQMRVWDQYFINIYDSFGGGVSSNYDLRHSDSDTGSTSPPVSW